MNRRILSLIVAGLLAAASSARAQCSLIISEYIEGSSNNKAIELYNGTGASIDLLAGNYVLQQYNNGSATPGTALSLTGVVAAGATYVIVNSSASNEFTSVAQQLTPNSSPMNYNGDDALVLRSGGASGTIIDSLGQVGTDPGTEWGTGLTSTADNTIRRKASITVGDTSTGDAFDPATEWDGFANNASDGLGAHTMNCGATNTAPALSTIGNKSTTNGSSLVFLVSAADTVDNDEITLSASNLPSGAVFAPASAFTGVTNTFTWNPVGAVGVYTTTFYAVDNDGFSTQTIFITVFAAPATNQIPVLTVPSVPSALDGATVSFSVSAADVIDNDPITLSASNLPGTATFATVTNLTGVTNTFLWTGATPVGVYTAQFYAVDKDGVTNRPVVITVQNPAVALGTSNVWINEINYDTPGTDSNEYVEVAGVAGVDLSAYSLVLYNNDTGAPYFTTNLTGIVITNEGCGYGAEYVLIPGIQNGAPDGVALLEGANVLQFLGYEGNMTASNGPAAGLVTSADMGTQTGTNVTLQLSGTGTNYSEYAWTTNTASPGLLNVAQYITGCSAPPVTLAFSPAAATVAENGVTVDVLVYKSAAASNITAQLVVGGTATQVVDFTISTTNISLAGATTSQVVTITLVDDGVFESNETVVLTFTNLAEGVVGSPSQHTLTITDDDQLLLTITTATQTVQSDITALDVGGTASANLVGELVWSNQLTGGTGTTPAGTSWLISGVPLDVGINTISVIGTNAAGGSVQALRNLSRLAEPRAGTAFILTQDFEATDTWAIVSGAAQVSTNVGVGDFPDSQRLANGTQSWQVSSANVTLELASVSIAGYTGRQVNVRVSSTALSGAQGTDGGDHVRVFVALNGAAFASTGELDLAGNSNARWGFTATNHAAIPAGTAVSVAAPQGGESVNNFSDLYVLIPDSATSLAVRVQAQTDSANEIWNIDAIRVTGYGGVNPDADGDLMPDAWEQDNFGGSTTNEAAGDHDGDGISNLDEYISGTAPTNGTSFLELTSITSTPSTVVSFFGATGRLYRLDYRDNLLDLAGWTEFTNNIPGTNGLMLVPRGDVTNARSFRVRVQLP